MSLSAGRLRPSVNGDGDGDGCPQDRRARGAQGPLVDRAAHLRRRARRLRRLRDLGQPGQRELLRRPVPLAVLLAVPRAELRASDTAAPRLVVEPLGGYLDSFHRASLRFRLWSLANRLNARHNRWAWASLVVVGLTDLYIRLVAAGVVVDPRWVS